MGSQYRQSGFAMLDLTLALIISAMMTLAAIQVKLQADRMQIAEIQGGGMDAARKAAEAYASENFRELQNGLPVAKNGVSLNSGTARGQSYAPTVDNLIGMGYLTPGFSEQSAFSNTPVPGNYQIRVNRTPAGCEIVSPTTCDVTGLVYIDQPIVANGTTEIDGPAITAMLSKVGAYGGVTLPMNSDQIIGSGATWQGQNPLPGNPAGVVAARFGFNSSGMAQFVRLNDSRDPNLQGKLTVVGDITGKANVGTSDGVAACLRAAMQADGEIVSRAANCVVRAKIDPNTGTVVVNDAAGTTTVGIDGNNGAVTANRYGAGSGASQITLDGATGRMTGAVANLTSLSIPGAACVQEGDIARDNTSAASGLLVCRSGRYVSTVVAAGGANSGTPCVDEGQLVRNLDPLATGILVCRAGVYRDAGGLKVASAGGPCAPNGAMGQTSSGSSLICQNGVWVDLVGRMGNFAFVAAYEIWLGNAWANQGAAIAKPTCLANGVPKVYLVPKSDDQIGFINRYATDPGGASPWRAYVVDGNNAPVYAVLIAQTYCYYT
jgi:type II secretory pathway pseudopilin PulG